MKRTSLTILLAAILFTLAFGMTLYPAVSNYVNQRYASEIVTSYEGIVEQSDNSALRQEWEKANSYNATLVPVTAEQDAFSQEAIQAAAADYSQLLNITGNGIMGYVEIPAISVRLPIYHGTDADVLERGVGHLLGSSLPVGGSSTHTVLTGHSGMAANKMFTDLEQLKTGDVFYLHILDETLAYQVSEMDTVLPHETDLLGVVQEADLCTLVTCTPYGVNSHRLLVHAHRIPYHDVDFMQGRNGPKLKIDYTQYNFVYEPCRLALIDSRIFGIPFEGYDYYQDGVGGMKGVIAKAITLFHQSGADMNRACLATYLAESMFAPSILLQDYITFEEISDYEIKATITYGGQMASGVFSFNKDYEMVSFTTNDRAVIGMDGAMEYIQWSALCGEYTASPDGILHPTRLQAVWNYPDGDFVYFDGIISKILRSS